VVLAVDDDASVRDLLVLTIESAGMRALSAGDGDEALALLADHAVDVVLLDNDMPVRDGPATLAEIRARPRTAAIPVIFITGIDDAEARVSGLEAGADDYVGKPFDPDEVIARIRALLRGRAAWQRALQHRLDTRSEVADALGRIRADAPPRDLAAALCAGLGGLAPDMSVALVLFDEGGEANRIGVTGAFAHRGRGRIARAMGARLRHSMSRGGWIERREAQPADAVGVPLASGDLAAAAYVPLTASGRPIGLLALADGHAARRGEAADCLAAGVDLAPLVAALLRPLLGDDTRDRDRRRALMRRRITGTAFHPVYQPVLHLVSHKVIGFEALTRFADGEQPESVFAEATALGLGIELESATASVALAAADGLPGDAWLAINVSPAFVTTGARLAGVFGGRARDDVVLELTEHDPIDDYRGVLDAVAALDGDFRLSVDDAGAGYACLHHVLQLRPAFVKLDRGWVAGIESDPARQALVAGLGDFADRTGGHLIAEGIETAHELAALTGLGVPFGQGWHLGHPAAVGRRTPSSRTPSSRTPSSRTPSSRG
jgi:EAL domain-containing protein (putative c-di-GMP-specific phosphodiesterase class I)/CheY-like chemotaxis protein